MSTIHGPGPQGLYDPANEHDACGVGFVVDIRGRKSAKIVKNGIQILLNLEHRGAVGCEVNSGDGAGILIQVPHKFLAGQADHLGIKLPPPGQYGVGMVFLPTSVADREVCQRIFEQTVRAEGQVFLGWRDVPTDSSMLGPTAAKSQPVIKQMFIGRGAAVETDEAFERKLYVIRRLARHEVRRSGIAVLDRLFVVLV